jgi:hypothetical protein
MKFEESCEERVVFERFARDDGEREGHEDSV